MKIESKYLILVTLAGFIIALDQITKMYIHTHLELGEGWPVIRDFFNITYVRNTGAAFGIFRDSHEIFRTLFFLGIPPIAILIILGMLRSVENEDRLQVLSLSMIFGGAIGNYIDRLRFGYVIDFLDFHFRNVYSFPAFNVADSAIVCGVFLLVAIMTYRERQVRKTAQLESRKA